LEDHGDNISIPELLNTCTTDRYLYGSLIPTDILELAVWSPNDSRNPPPIEGGVSVQAFILAEATDQEAGEGHFHGLLSMNYSSPSFNIISPHTMASSQCRAGGRAYSALSPLHSGMDKSEQ